MGKSQIKSQCQISNHSVNRFKLFNQISNPIFSSNLKSSSDKSQIKSQIFDFRCKLNAVCSLIFHNSKNVILIQPVSDHSHLQQYCLSVTQNCTACEHTERSGNKCNQMLDTYTRLE